MNKSKAARIAGFVAAVGASAALVGAAASTTGAYFTDSHDLTANGAYGSIKISTTHGNEFVWDNLLPGEPRSSTLGYQNTGKSAEDVWVVFPDSVLSEINQLGHYATATIQGNGVTVFNSTNLNGASTCPATDANGPTDCAPLPKQVKVASNVAPGATGDVTFTFGITGKATNQDNWTGTFTMPLQLVATQNGKAPDTPNVA